MPKSLAGGTEAEDYLSKDGCRLGPNMKIVQLAPQSASKLLPHLSVRSSCSFTSTFSLLALVKSVGFCLFLGPLTSGKMFASFTSPYGVFIHDTHIKPSMALACAVTAKYYRKFQGNSSPRLKVKIKFTKLQSSRCSYVCHLLFQTCIWETGDKRQQK